MKINELIHQFNKLKMHKKTKINKCKQRNQISKLHKIGIHLFKGKNIGFSKYYGLKSILIELMKQYNQFYELQKNDCIYEINFKIKKLNNEVIDNIHIQL